MKLKLITITLISGSLYALGPSVKARPLSDAKTEKLKALVSQCGTISFQLHTDKTYLNGQGQENYSQKLLVVPGISTILFKRTNSVANIFWIWDDRAGHPKFYDTVVDFYTLPGPETYFMQFTWDSARGVSEAYINGIPLRIPGSKFKPWWVKKSAGKVLVGNGRLKISDLDITPAYTPPGKALAAVPKELRGRHKNLIGNPKPQPPDANIIERRGKLLYEASMNDPRSVKNWIKEGPVNLRFENGSMLMRSKDFAGNIVFWCPVDFPDSFIAEWDFDALSHYGLVIVFFAAKGAKGEDIFAATLPKRDGRFMQYIKGAIISYHISYFANIENFQMGRTDSNLRKNNKFYRVGGGPVAVKPDAKGWQKIRLVKDANRIQLYNNGVLYVDWTDNQPERYGKPHKDGKIGLRQMTPTIGRYRNFKVWALKPGKNK